MKFNDVKMTKNQATEVLVDMIDNLSYHDMRDWLIYLAYNGNTDMKRLMLKYYNNTEVFRDALEYNDIDYIEE